jgi:acylglycerol lipase
VLVADFWTVQPEGDPKAKLVFIHGFSDHIGRYYGLFPLLSERGIAVYGLDQRGWGRSVTKPAEKGLTGPTSRVIGDIVAFLTPHLPSSPSDPPLFIMGHSMGGGEVLTLACDPAHAKDVTAKVRGWLCESPFIGFAPELAPSSFKIIAGRIAGKLLPTFQLVEPIPPENLSRDPAVVESIREDKLMHNTGTLEGLSGMLDRTEALTHGKARPPPEVKALWIGHGTADKGTSYEASKKWFDECTENVKDKQFKTYEGCYHQLHADYGKETFYADVAEWILARISSEPAASKL